MPAMQSLAQCAQVSGDLVHQPGCVSQAVLPSTVIEAQVEPGVAVPELAIGLAQDMFWSPALREHAELPRSVGQSAGSLCGLSPSTMGTDGVVEACGGAVQLTGFHHEWRRSPLGRAVSGFRAVTRQRGQGAEQGKGGNERSHDVISSG